MQTAVRTQPTSTSTARVIGRWMTSFAGFPLGGLAAKVIAGPIDATTAALVGGAIGGAVLGAAQSWGMGRGGPASRIWVAATALGFALGLTIGATVVDFGTDVTSLVVQGAICGAAVGAAQALALGQRAGRLAILWPLALAALWALGWAITTVAGVKVDEQFTVFGASGAITVTAATAVLPVRDPSPLEERGHEPPRRVRHRPSGPPRRRRARGSRHRRRRREPQCR